MSKGHTLKLANGHWRITVTGIHYVSTSRRKKFELGWRQNLQNDVCRSSVENSDIFSMAEFGFGFIAKRQGSLIIK